MQDCPTSLQSAVWFVDGSLLLAGSLAVGSLVGGLLPVGGDDGGSFVAREGSSSSSVAGGDEGSLAVVASRSIYLGEKTSH